VSGGWSVGEEESERVLPPPIHGGGESKYYRDKELKELPLILI